MKYFKKHQTAYQNIIKSGNPRAETVIYYLNRKNKAYEKSRQSANDSLIDELRWLMVTQLIQS